MSSCTLTFFVVLFSPLVMWASAAPLASAAPGGSGEPVATVTTLDGRRLEGTIAAADRNQLALVRADGATEKLALAELIAIEFPGRSVASLLATAGQQVLVAEDGSQVAIKEATISGGRLTALLGMGSRLSVPLENCARLLRPRAHEKPAEIEKARTALKISRGQEDVLLTSGSEGRYVPLQGIIEALEGGKLRFHYEGTATEMEAATVVLVEPAKTATTTATSSVGQLITSDGSILAFSALEVSQKDMRLATPSLGRLSVPLAQVVAIRFRPSDRLVYLSDLVPIEVRQTPFFDEDFPYRKDQSVVGGPLRTGGITYAKGLGLHARCEMTFELGGGYRQFSATAGIDEAVRAGKAKLSILADGKPMVAELLLDRAKPPEQLRLGVEGVKRLTVLVDFVENTFGSGARVNLCDPILTK